MNTRAQNSAPSRQSLEQGDRRQRSRQYHPHLAAVGDEGPLVPGPLGPLVPLARRIDGPLVPEVSSSEGRVVWSEHHIALIEAAFGPATDHRFPCPIPGHHGQASIGAVPDSGSPEPRLLCCQGRWRSLGEVRAAIGHREDALRSNIADAIWTRRLAYDVGALVPPFVSLPLPAQLSAAARRHRDGFQLLVALRRWDHPPRAVAWTVRFAAAWCSTSQREAHLALRQMRDLGVIVETERVGGGARAVRCYEPGNEASGVRA